MKNFYVIVFIFLLHFSSSAQTIDASGVCITGTITLNYVGEVEGKPAFEGTGTVDGFANVAVSILWIVPENLWVLAFDGQPYFQNACTTPDPPGTSNASCPWTVVDGTTCTGVAALSLTGSGILPVRLVSFTATAINNEVQLDWITAMESNNKGFEIQRSQDGINWLPVGFVNGAGNSSSLLNYQFLDKKPLAGKNFYRLLQTDLDGRFSYSKIVSINITDASFYTLKNNSGNGVFDISIRSNSQADIFIMDLSGRQLIKRTVEGGDHQLDISRYPAGIYLLRLQKGNEIMIEKLVKQ